jgi:arylsulfatase A-like enzyme
MIMRWPAGLVAVGRGQKLTQTVELRDILPTFLEAAGTPPSRPVDGRSLLALTRGRTQDWREYLDLEHGVCYAPQNHWNALTNGREKYIYHAYDGSEQLFDLERDPHELDDLAGKEAETGRLRKWRTRMIEHLAPRGAGYVNGGRLVPRPAEPAFSPNFPGCACHGLPK